MSSSLSSPAGMPSAAAAALPSSSSSSKKRLLTRASSSSPSIMTRQLLFASSSLSQQSSSPPPPPSALKRSVSSPAGCVANDDTATASAEEEDVLLPPRPETVAQSLLHTLTQSKRTRSAKQDQLLHDRAVRYFNLNPAIGMRFFHAELQGSTTDASALAVFLKTTSGINKVKLGQTLAGNALLREAFLGTFDFAAFPATCAGVEAAFRHFLSFFKLPGEGQEIDRLLEAFCSRFHHFHSLQLTMHCQDTTHQFLFLLILLNVNLHNPAAAASLRPMSRAKFVECYGKILCNKPVGLLVSEQELAALYDSVRTAAIVFVPDRAQLAGSLFARPDMTGWLKTSATTFAVAASGGGRALLPPWRLLARTWFAIMAHNSLYLFRSPDDAEFEYLVPLENLRLFANREEKEEEEQPLPVPSSSSCFGGTPRGGRYAHQLVFVPCEPLHFIKVGRLTKQRGMCLQEVTSLTLRTESKTEHDCWLAVLSQKGLARSQTYSILTAPSSPLLTTSQSAAVATKHSSSFGRLRGFSSSPSTTPAASSASLSFSGITTSSPMPRHARLANLREVMEKCAAAEEDEDNDEESDAALSSSTTTPTATGALSLV